MKVATAFAILLLTALRASSAPVIFSESPEQDTQLDPRDWSEISLESINKFRPPLLNPSRTVVTFDIPPPLYDKSSIVILSSLANLREAGSFQLFNLHRMRHVDQHIATFHFGSLGKLTKVEKFLREQNWQEVGQGKIGFVFNTAGEEYLRHGFGDGMHEVLRMWFQAPQRSLLWQGTWDGPLAVAGR